MFVQLIEGHTTDAEAVRRQMEIWMSDLRPGAPGFLGATAGVTDDGTFIAVARFESASAATANSERPEQGDWWADTEKHLDGAAGFVESEDVEAFLGGGSDDAGFVQIMKSTGIDRDEMKRLDAAFEKTAATFRPDVIGSLRFWTAPDAGYDVTYFTSETDARAAEAMPPPPELAELMEEFESMMTDTEFIDLSDPWLY